MAFFGIPILISKLVKYLILYPVYFIAGLFLNKKVGEVKQDVTYYADLADWYIEELLNTDPAQMDEEQLFNLSYLYSELTDINVNV